MIFNTVMGSQDISVITKPTVTVGTYQYNGSAQGPTITNSTNDMIITNATKTNAGTYTLIIALRKPGLTVWSDGTIDSLKYEYTISKADPVITVSKENVTLNKTKLSDTVSVSVDSGGALSAQSDDTTIATVSLSNGVLTINSVNNTSGTAVVSVHVAETANYNAGNKQVSVTCSFAQVYGAEWDGTSTTSWSRTDAAQGFSDPSPAVNNGNGSSPFDNIMPWSGMVRSTNSSAGTIVSIPKFWYKWTRDGSKMKLQIADGQMNGFYVSPAHADRGDGKGERDVVYVGAYHCATSTYKSTTGVLPGKNITRSTARANIHNLGTNIWQWDYAMLWTIRMLYLVQFADWNSQAKIGYGCGNNSSTVNMGQCDSMTYHTGTSTSSRTAYGYTRYRWIEGLWDNVCDWVDGIYFSSANIYCIKNPSNFSDSSGGTLTGTRSTASSSYISAWNTPSVSGFEYALYPSAHSGSQSTYITDYCDYNSSGVVLFVGGHYFRYQYCGLFYSYGNYAASGSYAYVGSRLMLLP